MKKKKILVVDDEKNIRENLKEELTDYGYEVICADSGYKALEKIVTGKIDLLITDIAMPDMNGYELYNRTKEYNEDIPIIMMTGFGYDPDHIVVKTKKAGLNDVLFKPFTIEQLVALINKYLNK